MNKRTAVFIMEFFAIILLSMVSLLTLKFLTTPVEESALAPVAKTIDGGTSEQ